MPDQKLYTGATKVVLAFDIGTTHSKIAYSILREGELPEVSALATTSAEMEERSIKVPTLLYYDPDGSLKAAGFGALAEKISETAAEKGWRKAECWKLHLMPQHLTSAAADPYNSTPPLPLGKTALDVLTDFIKYLFQIVKDCIQEGHSPFNWSSIKDSIEFIFTHPNGWEGAQRQKYRRAIEDAGLVPSTPEGGSRVRLMTECEASLHYCAKILWKCSSGSQGLVIIDAGSGTIDCRTYRGAGDPISCEETATAQCYLQGSVFLMSQATARAKSPVPTSNMRPVPCSFDDTAHVFQDDSPGFFQDMFQDLVFNSIKAAFEEQRKISTTMIKIVFLIGGFSMNDRILARVKSYFEDEGITLHCSAEHSNKAVTTGAVLSHIDGSPSRPLVRWRASRATSSQAQPMIPSAARDRWENQKRTEGVQNMAIDEIMEMVGLEHVKGHVMDIKAIVDTAKRQGVPIDKERLNLLLVGNPGTGKTTFAKLYSNFLSSVGALRGEKFSRTTGSKLSFFGLREAKELVDDMGVKGGTIFVDDAHQLVSENDRSGTRVLDYLLDKMDNKAGTLALIFAGYNGPMEKFLEHSPGLSSRIPHQLRFSDYTHNEFMWMLEDLINTHYKGWMEVEGGIDGVYIRIAVRRLVRGSGKPGFGNVRALENMFSKIRQRQAARMEMERKLRMQVDAFLLTKEDLIGPDPSKVLHDSEPWKKLQEMIGLESVKDSVRSMFRLLETNYQRELAEKEPIQVSLNRVFVGSPGTGKTSVAKLYGQILAELEMLSKGEVVIKNPSDFVGSYMGGSERNTKAILDSAQGKVLVIDEAYMLYNKDNSNSYHTAVIDTMVAEIQSIPGEDRCVLLLGYKDQMEEMFQNVNPGLSRRFAIENAFNFEDFTEPQLMQILDLKLREQDLHASEEAKQVAGEVLCRLKVRPNFGNAGEVDNLLGQAKARCQKRISSTHASHSVDVTFEPEDFDPDFARSQIASENLDKIFSDVVGCVEVKEKLDGYQKVAVAMKKREMDLQEVREMIPTSFIFKGPSGTGKTTIARKVGQIYYDMGFLSSAEVVECSATDLTGQYVGQTGPKTKGLFEKTLGKVLFIDEAYRLGDGHYAKEALEEIVGLMSNERFMNKLVIILAGYEKEMNSLLETNPGLSSRFPEDVIFPNLTSGQCLELLDQDLRKKKVDIAELRPESSSTSAYINIQRIIDQMSVLPSWGNARDIKTLGKRMVLQAFKNTSRHQKLSLSAEDASRIAEDMLKEQQARQQTSRTIPLSSTQTNTTPCLTPPRYSPPRRSSPVVVARDLPPPVRADMTVTLVKRDSEPAQAQITPIEDDAPRFSVVQRDPGVSDAVWNQLQKDAKVQKGTRQAEEEKIQRVLQDLGLCRMGFEWIRQANGYRCAGGSHFMSHKDLAWAV